MFKRIDVLKDVSQDEQEILCRELWKQPFCFELCILGGAWVPLPGLETLPPSGGKKGKAVRG